MGEEFGENSWAAERKLVHSKIHDFADNQKNLFKQHSELSTKVTVISTKLGGIAIMVSTVVSVAVGIVTKMIGE